MISWYHAINIYTCTYDNDDDDGDDDDGDDDDGDGDDDDGDDDDGDDAQKMNGVP